MEYEFRIRAELIYGRAVGKEPTCADGTDYAAAHGVQEPNVPITPIVIQCPLLEALTALTQRTESIRREVRGMLEYLPNLRFHADLTTVENSMAEIQRSLRMMNALLEQAGKKNEKRTCKWLSWLPDFDLILVSKWIVLVLLIVGALLGMVYGIATVVGNIQSLLR